MPRSVLLAVLTLLAPLVLASGPALAVKSPAEKEARTFFTDRHWVTVRDYYNEQMRAGICPIGFAKKDDGCQPPRHKRNWDVGKPLPPGAIRFDLPPALVTKLGKPPAGHRYVRVVDDVLLVSNRSKLVVDGILNLGRKA